MPRRRRRAYLHVMGQIRGTDRWVSDQYGDCGSPANQLSNI